MPNALNQITNQNGSWIVERVHLQMVLFVECLNKCLKIHPKGQPTFKKNMLDAQPFKTKEKERKKERMKQ